MVMFIFTGTDKEIKREPRCASISSDLSRQRIIFTQLILSACF